MRHPVIGVVGCILVGLSLTGLATTVFNAAVAHRPFYGANYKGLPLGTYTTMAVLAVALVAGIAWAIRWILGRIRRSQS